MLFENIRFALRAILRAPLRTALTLIGITFGVAAVVIVQGVGEGFQRGFEENMAQLGSNLLIVWSGRESQSVLQSGKRVEPLTLEDAEALMLAPHVKAVAPEVMASNSLAMVGNRNTRLQVRGVTPSYADVRAYEVELGRFLSPVDILGKRRVAVIGGKIWEDLLPGMEPLGKIIRVGGIPFTIVGVLESKGGSDGGGGDFSSADNLMLVPIRTAQALLVGGTDVHIMNVEATSLGDIAETEREVREILRRQHNLRYNETDDFQVFNSGEIVERVNALLGGFKVFLLIIGGISLFIGGIGIMNIMLVTVTERTGEIGLRKALGARDLDIRLQFIVEAIVLSLMGGLAGMALGYFGIQAMGSIEILGTPVFSSAVLLVALIVSMLIGVVFGLIPAHQASKLDPIVALRRH